MNKYLTHLEIPDEVRKALLKEFYDNIHKAKIYTASNGTITRSLPDMEVIRLQDAEDCVIGHKIAKNLSLMVDEVIKPRYYRQAAGSDLILTTQSTKSFDLSADGGAVILVSTGTGQW